MSEKNNSYGNNYENNFNIDIFSSKKPNQNSEKFDINKYDVYRNNSYEDVFSSGKDNSYTDNSTSDYNYFFNTNKPQNSSIPTEYEDVYSGAPMEDVWSSDSIQRDNRDRAVPQDRRDRSVPCEQRASSTNSSGGKRPNGKSKKKKNINKVATIVVVAISILSLVVSGGYVAVTKYLDFKPTDIDNDTLGVNTETVNKYGALNIVNIALFGLDSRDENSFEGHSDAIKIISINQKTAEVKVVTILRDSEVAIDNHGKEKITHAYGYGGAELAIKTINQNFGLDITEYVTVNFLRLGSVIDLLDGIDIEISEAERKEMNKVIRDEGSTVTPINQSGMVHLNGNQTSVYSRIRYGDSDNARTERQAKVMQCLLEKVRSLSPMKYPKLIKEGLKLVETSMDYSDIMSLVPMISKQLNISQLTVPDEKAYKVRGGTYGKGKQWVWQFDTDDATQAIHEYIFETDTTQEETTKND